MWRRSVLLLIGLYLENGTAQLLDSRCYLAEGGSTESFLANEDVAVGSLLGTLSVNGDPQNDIVLSLREKDAPVSIIPNSKNLVLSKPLDKEGIEGPASVYVNVICERRSTNDPSFVIPVNIRVIDVNDNSPRWSGAPYAVNVSEVTIIGTRILQGVRAKDSDQPGPYSTIEYQVLPGPHAKFISFISPLEGTLVLKHELNYETTNNLTIKLRAQDQGVPPRFADTTLTINVLDADDQNPRFNQDVYYGFFEANQVDSIITLHPEHIKAIDQDFGINASLLYSIVPSSLSDYFAIDPYSGTLKVQGHQNTTGNITLVIKATQSDNSDRYALSTVILSQKVSEENPETVFLTSRYKMNVKENYAVGSILKNLGVHPHGNQQASNVKYKILNETELHWFSVDNNGNIKLNGRLDYESKHLHAFTVEINDGINKSYVEMRIEVSDVNDWEPRFRKPRYGFRIVNNGNMTLPAMIGIVEAADGDINDRITYTLLGEQSDVFYIDSKGGLWLRQNITETKEFHLYIVATDSGVPPRTTMVPLFIDFLDTKKSVPKWNPSVVSGIGGVSLLLLVGIIATLDYMRRHKKRDKSNSSVLIDNNVIPSSVNHDYMRDSCSSVSASASTILAASLDMEHESYATTIKDIICRTQNSNIPNHRSNDSKQDSRLDSGIGPIQSNHEKIQYDSEQSGRCYLTVYF
ncbi:protocadherin Fat 2 [Toxorhynchites rutilus septentrionalis]|uniref:protocadherin Fat 2 n=1 Tax=Toxorhynchites rutilus septentrionalis TaxID=329112 RepID=UPI002479814E|nr:protocadherin Fat 2 [Toxorhynchites rutilus septentrionalis]XP_055639241.1 protocadherin Fat 2 [Toxorhynchites rutilus septentrionalis]XP_055639242.1 protocadherin Fat 2 [Toxorhynchites rutilus septentrionalis]